jgi:hypothetical protein
MRVINNNLCEMILCEKISHNIISHVPLSGCMKRFKPNRRGLTTRIQEMAGITPNCIAGYLHLHHHELNRYESNEGFIPAEAIAGLLALYSGLLGQPVPIRPPLPEALRVPYKNEAAYCLAKAARYRKQLATVQQRYRQGCVLYNWATAALADTAAIRTPRQQRWIECRQYDGKRWMAKNGYAAQKALEIQIALLEREAALLEVPG